MNQYLLFFLTSTSLLLLSSIAEAQVYQPSNRAPVADNTLGTQVSGNGNNVDITGGLTKGQTLFHSFTDFSVPTNGAANFLNPVGNRDIITRVTGSLFSDINGTLNSNGANFFLINPNGIVFGTNARLNVGKAFVTSTANGINLVDGNGSQIVFGTNPNGDAPLLTINPNVLFNVSSLAMGGGNGQISNFGTLKTTNDSQYIGLIGGNINLNGGKIIAPGGRVDIGGLKTNGTVSVNGEGLVFNGANLVRSDVSITNGSSVSVRANQNLNPVDPVFFPSAISPSSSINISANKIDLSNSGNRFIATTNNSINQSAGGLDAGLEVNSGIKTGTIGNIKLDATGDIKIQKSAIFNLVRSGAQGNGGGIQIMGNNIAVTDKSEISTNLSENAVGRGGDIEINARGNINISEPAYPNVRTTITDTSSTISSTPRNNSSKAPAVVAARVEPESAISASTDGSGNSGKVKIAAQGNVVVSDRNTISSVVGATGAGNSGGIQINASSLSLLNGSQILTFADVSKTAQQGNAGNIDITTTGNITISGTQDRSVLAIDRRRNPLVLSKIDSNSFRAGNAGKITLIAPGKLSVVNRSAILSSIRQNGAGDSGGINLNVGELLLSNFSEISSSLGGGRESTARGTSGDINITGTGNITIDEPQNITDFEGSRSAPSIIANSINGTATKQGGKITIKTPGKVSVGNHNAITSTVESNAAGNAGGIAITAGELDVFNEGQILTVVAEDNNGKGDAGNIDIKTTGDIRIVGNINPAVGQDSGERFLAKIASSNFRSGNPGKITIDAGGKILLLNKGGIKSETSRTNSGDLTTINSNQIKLDQSNTANIPNSRGNSSGNITINSKQLTLNRGNISAASTESGSNINIATQDLIFMRRNSNISSESKQGGNGGNIRMDSRFLIATTENNDITANAIKGRGGNVNINAQGVFGIQFRPLRNNNTSDITASSEFGQTGNVKIDTLGLDPGRDSTELPNTTTDASTQISQACGASTRQNKLTVTGRGGLPPTAYDPLTSDVVWQDARAASSQPTATRTPVAPLKLVSPAVGWVIGAQGKVTLIAAGDEALPTGIKVVCPNVRE